MLSADGLLDILDYRFIPWGNAYYNTSECGGPSFDKTHMFCWVEQCGSDSPPADCFSGPKVCQHGTDECEANTLEACAKSLYPQPKDFAPFVTCFEGEHRSQSSAVGPCAKKAGLDAEAISGCAKNATMANALDAANACVDCEPGNYSVCTLPS